MGVYHLMGLGRSPGAITGPISYLAHRYHRWNADDQRFFGRSGEINQRQGGEKVGDVQALVLFTTQEVLIARDKSSGKPLMSYNYVDNSPGSIAKRPMKKGGPMKEVLRELLRREWPTISGGRPQGDIFWCEVDRRDIFNTYERVVQVVAALASVGGQGKEIWINLTGGNNVINFVLELVATLSGEVARLYYVQAENQDAEKCVRYTAENDYWVDLPVMPLALGRLSQAIIELLIAKGPISMADLYSTLQSEYWDLSRGLTSQNVLREEYLSPLWKQGLVAEASDSYIIGPQWTLIQPYETLLKKAKEANSTIEQLAKNEPWIEREPITFH